MELFSDATQNVKSAAEFYEGKVKDLAGNITDLESIIQNKSSSLRAVEEGKAGTFHGIPAAILTCAGSPQAEDPRTTTAAFIMRLAVA